jgi:hypothetical protein
MNEKYISRGFWLALLASFSLVVIAIWWDHHFMERPQIFAVLVSPYVPGTKSRVKCFNESLISTICVYENAILRDGQFVIAGDFANLSGSYHESRTLTGARWKPTIVRSFSGKIPSRVLPGLSVFYAPFFPLNVGHALLDSIYPVFVALARLGRDTKITILL